MNHISTYNPNLPVNYAANSEEAIIAQAGIHFNTVDRVIIYNNLKISYNVTKKTNGHSESIQLDEFQSHNVAIKIATMLIKKKLLPAHGEHPRFNASITGEGIHAFDKIYKHDEPVKTRQDYNEMIHYINSPSLQVMHSSVSSEKPQDSDSELNTTLVATTPLTNRTYSIPPTLLQRTVERPLPFSGRAADCVKLTQSKNSELCKRLLMQTPKRSRNNTNNNAQQVIVKYQPLTQDEGVLAYVCKWFLAKAVKDQQWKKAAIINVNIPKRFGMQAGAVATQFMLMNMDNSTSKKIQTASENKIVVVPDTEDEITDFSDISDWSGANNNTYRVAVKE